MVSNSEYKHLIKEKYLKIKDLLKINEPPSDVSKSQNEAITLLIEMKEIFETNESEDHEMKIQNSARLAGVYYLLGSINATKGETTIGEDYLLKSFNLIEENSTHPYCILGAVDCLDQIGLLYAHCCKNEDALSYLKKSVTVYENYTSAENVNEPVTLDTMFADILPLAEKSGKMILERAHTLTLYYIAQLHTALDDEVKGALYCHETLRRQIESNDYDHVEWALNAATMSQVLIKKNAFKAARHHLATAAYVLDLYEQKLNESSEDSENIEAIKEEITRKRCDILRCWIKYCIVLLSYSKERLLTDDDNDEYEPPPKELKDLKFPILQNSLNEEVVSYKPLLTFEDARPVFLFGQQCCNDAVNYYTLENHASDYSSISIDHNRLYEGLAFFEDDEDRQCKMLKRRLDILKNIVINLNPEYYLDLCQVLWTILGQICTEMAELKIKKFKVSGNDSLIKKQKINSIVEEGVNYYLSYINSFIDKRTNKMPLDYPKDHEKLIISANLYAARLYTKYLPLDRSVAIEINKKCLKIYETIIEYSKTHKEIAEEMPGEINIASDMVHLIPFKLSRLAKSDNCNRSAQ